jgi:hypothetical protein
VLLFWLTTPFPTKFASYVWLHISIMANLFGGEPPTFYTSRECHQLNTRLPDCRICSAIVETSGHQYARSHSWFAISRAVPWSCIQSGELKVADSLQSWTGMRKGCYLLDIDVSQARGEEGQRFRCTYASTTHPGSPIDDTLKTLATVCNSTSSATTLSLSSPATATAALAACQLLASPCIEFNWGMWGTARIWRRWTLHSSYHKSKLYCSGCTSPCV